MADEQEQEQIVTYPQERVDLLADVTSLRRVLSDVATSLDTSKPEMGMKLINALNKSDNELRTMIGKPFEVEHVTIKVISKPSKDGSKMEHFPRVLLHCPDGRVISASSFGVLDSIRLISLFRGNAPWTPPVKCQGLLIPTTDGKALMRLEVIS